MRNHYTSPKKATVCYSSNCITVYGETAQLLNGIVLTVTAMSLVALLYKALK